MEKNEQRKCHYRQKILYREYDERLDNIGETKQRERASIDKSNMKSEPQNHRQPRIQTAKEARDRIYGQYLEDD